MTIWQGSVTIGAGAAINAAASLALIAAANISVLAGATPSAGSIPSARITVQVGAGLQAHFQTKWLGTVNIQSGAFLSPQLPLPASAAVMAGAALRVVTGTVPVIASVAQLNQPGDVTPYINLITSEHAGKPKFIATVTSSIRAIVDAAAAMQQTPGFYDLDAAVGAQEDVLGEWIGVDRNLAEPIDNVYFAWDTDGLGWDSGFWQGPLDPDSGIVRLPDDAYRVLLRARIAANNWDGTIPGAYAAWDDLFGGALQLLIQDFGNMTMAMGILSNTGLIDPITLALLTSGKLDIRPATVQITEYFTGSTPGQAVFAWDVDPPTQSEAGWDTGVWSIQLT